MPTVALAAASGALESLEGGWGSFLGDYLVPTFIFGALQRSGVSSHSERPDVAGSRAVTDSSLLRAHRQSTATRAFG